MKYNYNDADDMEIQMTNPKKASSKNKDVIEYNKINITVVSNNATIRPLPNHVVNRISTISKGTALTNCEKVYGSLVANSNVWYKVTYKNKECYIHSSYVEICKV